MMRMNHCIRSFVLALVIAQCSFAALREEQVLLLYNSMDDESAEIATYYLARHPDVVAFDLRLVYADPPDPNQPPEYVVNKYYITPDAYSDFVRAPLLNFIQTDPDAAEAVAIATTRGLPAAITVDFSPGASHDFEEIKGSFEANLARLDTGTPGTIGPVHNPHYGKLDVSFTEFLAEPAPGGSCAAGKMFLVSRLDSDAPASDYDGNGVINHLDGVKALIDRSLNLIVNTMLTTIVLDDKPPPCTFLGRERGAID